jgi:hypothetical protein
MGQGTRGRGQRRRIFHYSVLWRTGWGVLTPVPALRSGPNAFCARGIPVSDHALGWYGSGSLAKRIPSITVCYSTIKRQTHGVFLQQALS